MTKFKLPKGIDIKPLGKLGLKEEEAGKLLASLMPMIDLELKAKIKGAFNQKELKEIGQEAESKGIKPEEGMFFLEEKYHQKTDNYFMEELRLLINQYVKLAAKMIKQVTNDVKTYSKTGKKEQQKLEKLIKDKKWDQVAKKLDQLLKKKNG